MDALNEVNFNENKLFIESIPILGNLFLTKLI